MFKKILIFINIFIISISNIIFANDIDEYYNDIDKKISKYIFKMDPEKFNLETITPFLDSAEKENFVINWSDQNSLCISFTAFNLNWVFDLNNIQNVEDAKKFWTQAVSKNNEKFPNTNIVILITNKDFNSFFSDETYIMLSKQQIEKLNIDSTKINTFNIKDIYKYQVRVAENAYRLFVNSLK